LKRIWRARWKTLRQRLVLTAEEKRVLIFLLIAFLLGLTIKHYRATRPQAATTIEARESLGPEPAPKKSPRKRQKESVAANRGDQG
jgi:hypothetical protein